MHQLKSPKSCPVFVEADPPSRKPVIFLLHGFMMSRAIWLENLASLSTQYRCVIIELLGHGRSGAPDHKEAYKLSSYVAAIDNIRKQLGGQACCFAAHSFGAGIALAYGLSHPENTAGIVFTNSRSALGAIKPRFDETKKIQTALLSKGSEIFETMPAHPKNMKRIKPHIRKALINDVELISAKGITHSISSTADFPNLSVRLTQLQVPTLLINGIYEKGFQASRDKLEDQCPNINISDVEAGHSPNAEIPATFNELILSFLSRTKST